MNRLNCFFSLMLSLWTVCAVAKTPPVQANTADASPRVAVLCEQQDPELLGLSEQVEVLLAQRNDMALLDRANMDQLLREQGLLAKQGQDMETMVRIGKLLRTDLLVVAGKYEGFFAWRFVDVKNGVLAGLHVTRWPAEQRSTAAAEAEKAIVTITRQIGDGTTEGRRYLSIVRFVNQDLSRKYDSLEEVLPVLLSAQLASQPGIGLVERSRLGKVAEEKVGTEGVEGGYKAGTLIVKGEISILRSNATTSVSVLLLAGKPNQEATIRLTCMGSPADLPSLARTMTEQLLKAMEMKTTNFSQTDMPSEAGTFHLRGNFYMVHGDVLSALSLYETACLLNPTNAVYRESYRAVRRNVIGNAGYSQKFRLRYYIEDVDDWKSRFYSGELTPVNVAQGEGWHHTDCIAMGEPKSQPLADQWRIAYDGYKTLLDLKLDYCKTNKVVLSYPFQFQLWSNLFERDFFKDPHEVCRFAKKYMGPTYLYIGNEEYKILSPHVERYYSDLQKFAQRHILSGGTPSSRLDEYARVIFEDLTQDDNPLIRVWSKLALIKTGQEQKVGVRAGQSDVGQSIVNELALWEKCSRPCGNPYHDGGTPVMDDLLMYLIRNNKRDIIPAVEAMRQALEVRGASYTKAMDALSHQIYRYCVQKNKDALGRSSERVTTSYYEWIDIFRLYLYYQLSMGQKDNAIKISNAVLFSEKTSGSPEKAAECMSKIKHIFSLYGHQYTNGVPEVIQVAPVITQEREKEIVQYAKVAWHLRTEDIPNGGHYYFKGQVVLKDDKILYYDYYNPYNPVGAPDTRQGYFDVTVIDLKTGRILQQPFYHESLRHRSDPELGLPKQEVRSWCEMDGRYYVGCAGGFGVFSEGVFTLLASCRKENTSQPLDGGTPYTVVSICPNASQKKLYLVIQAGDERNGVWEYTPETGAQKRLTTIASGIEDKIKDASWCDTRLFVSGARYNLVFNTQSPNESFVVAQELKHHGFSDGKLVVTYSHIKSWQERGLRDVRGLDEDSPVSRSFNWIAQAVLDQHVIYTAHTFETKWINYLWKAGEKQPRRLNLIDDQGNEVTSIKWMSPLSVAKWTATPHGFLYQLLGGGIGLFTDLDSFIDPASAVTNKQDATINTSTMARKGKSPPPAAQRVPVAWHLEDKQLCKLDSIYAERTQLIITNDMLRYVSNVCFRGERLIRSHAMTIDMKTGLVLSSETSTNNLFVQQSEQQVPETTALLQSLGLQDYKPMHLPPVIQSGGTHSIMCFDDAFLIVNRLVPGEKCWVMKKTNRQNPPATISDVRWLDGSFFLQTIAASSRAIIYTPKFSAHLALLWECGENAPRAIVLVDENGNEVSPANYKAKEIYKWMAVPQGFLYQLGDGSIGLLAEWGPKEDPKEK